MFSCLKLQGCLTALAFMLFLEELVKKISGLPNFTTILFTSPALSSVMDRESLNDVRVFYYVCRETKFLWNPQNAWMHYFFSTKYCRLQKFIHINPVPSSFSAVIHSSYISGFDLHIFCGMHDAKSYLLRSNGKQEAFTRRESYELCTM